MFWHLFSNRLKILVHDKQLLFWTFLFPVILSTLFFLAFSKISSAEVFEPIPVVYIEQTEEDPYFVQTLESVSEGEEALLILEKQEKEEVAKQKLEKDEIKGYIMGKKLVVKENGMDQTILREFLQMYEQKKSTIEEIALLNQGKVTPQIIEEIMLTQDFIQRVSYSRENPDSTVNYFYTLITMACFYGGLWGIKEIRDIQANQSSRAVRINIAPVHKLKTLLCNLVATTLTNFASILLLLFYLIMVLKIDFGSQLALVIVSCLIGCITGIGMGMLIGVICKKQEDTKSGILTLVTMLGNFLAGMMYIDMKYIIHTYVPIIGYLNPCNLLTDAFYSLYYYDTYTRFGINLGILSIFALLFVMSTYFVIRRQKYESL